MTIICGNSVHVTATTPPIVVYRTAKAPTIKIVMRSGQARMMLSTMATA